MRRGSARGWATAAGEAERAFGKAPTTGPLAVPPTVSRSRGTCALLSLGGVGCSRGRSYPPRLRCGRSAAVVAGQRLPLCRDAVLTREWVEALRELTLL